VSSSAPDYGGKFPCDKLEFSACDNERVEIKEDRPIYTHGNVWAEPSIEQAAAYMREVYECPEEARALALRSQPGIKSLLSLEAAGERMPTRLVDREPDSALMATKISSFPAELVEAAGRNPRRAIWRQRS
jgi:hypothetical protein